MSSLALVVCDMQPDLLKSLPPVDRQALVDSVQIALDVARQAGWKVVFTGLRFEDSYKNVPPQHRLYGGLKRLNDIMGNDKVHWFLEGYDGSDICSSLVVGEDTVVWHPSHLPCTKLLEALHGVTHVTMVGIKASLSVQATCQYLCDRGLDVSVVRECVADDVPGRLTAVMDHLIPIYGNVISLLDFVDHAVGLDSYEYHVPVDGMCETVVSYCCNVGRGGHSSLFMAHLVQRSEWRPYPKQKWFDDFVKSYYCPLGKRVVDFCDEPKFSSISAFIKGREWLDEKEKLIDLAGKLMPETYLIQRGQWINQPPQVEEDEKEGPCWFVKEVNKNGGRAVQICHCLSDCMALTDPNSTYVVQQHIRHPLLTDDGRKCHIKFYSLLHCNEDGLWELYTYREAFLSTSPNQWSPTDISSDTQVTIKRHQRLKFGQSVKGWETHASAWPAAYQPCRDAVAHIVGRAIEEGKLCSRPGQKQFEIFSADFMLDTSGRLWIIEFNFSPVLYDPMFHKEENLVTAGLKAYDKLYKIHGDKVEINDHDMIRDIVSMVFYPKSSLPPNTLWDLAGQFRGEIGNTTV